jgi:hypothetical protein
VPVHFLKPKQEYTVRKKSKKINGYNISAGMKFRKKRSSGMVYRHIPPIPNTAGTLKVNQLTFVMETNFVFFEAGTYCLYI